MNPGELEALVALVASVSPRAVVEFGVNEGRTAAAILRNVPGIERYVGIDVPAGYVPAKAAQRNEVPAHPGHLAAADPRFELILRPRGSLDLLPEDLDPLPRPAATTGQAPARATPGGAAEPSARSARPAPEGNDGFDSSPEGNDDSSGDGISLFDAAFIDGDHSWRGVLHDTLLAAQRVRPGGIVVWHDYHDLGTVDARDVLEILAADGHDIRHVEGTWLAFERV